MLSNILNIKLVSNTWVIYYYICQNVKQTVQQNWVSNKTRHCIRPSDFSFTEHEVISVFIFFFSVYPFQLVAVLITKFKSRYSLQNESCNIMRAAQHTAVWNVYQCIVLRFTQYYKVYCEIYSRVVFLSKCKQPKTLPVLKRKHRNLAALQWTVMGSV